MNRTLKNTLIILGKSVLAFVILILLYLSVEYITARITVKKEPDAPEEIAIYILTNGVHTDIVMPAKTEQMDWTQEIRYSNTLANDTALPYLAMGWGDKGFYLETPEWSDLKASVAFKAVFGLGNTAIHATYYKTMTEGARCRKIMISEVQYSRLISYIRKTFQTDSSGHFKHIVTNANYGRNDAFYEAVGSYSLFGTCNTWSNNALKACGQKACLWTAFDTGIFLKYKPE
ncbi:TIGR02117 family protein [Taibaiella sp. KBW10]|uniref:TIGR02117 family protein n=1 Tax=Taibaiella sp. KBW10 TaxID=2153357 RepID=UPI000F59A520|nr:TIGR02117 family protein [Taibaiella sp. KBW10]RQO31021.1 TIGR02117 family protein [Taibaiella sp. KBW10]